MDTRETYIKMCDCPEIQNNRHPSVGSLFWEPKMVEFGLFVLSSEKVQYQSETPWREALLVSLKDYRFMNLDHHAIWLPRQDQLQEMIGIKDVRELLLSFHRFTHPADGMHIRQDNFEEVKAKTKYRSLFTSMEQLWLAFVMEEKYNKVWDGQEWRDKEDYRR